MSTPEAGYAKQEAVPEELVLLQLDRLLSSPQFSGSERLSAFLKFAVENALRNQPEQLKEAVIAREIFGRDTYDGNLDSVVRGAARRLREKLDEYYEQAGSLDSVRIAMPKGAYLPVFSSLPAVKPLVEEPPPATLPATRGSGWSGWIAAAVVCCALLGYWIVHRQARSAASMKPAIAILPFRENAGDELLGYSIREDLTSRFAHMERVRVASRLSVDKLLTDRQDVLSWARKSDLTAVLEGKVSTSGDQVEITTDLTDVQTGYLLWTQKFQCQRGNVPATDRLISEEAGRALGLKPALASHVPESAAYDLYYRGRFIWEHGDVTKAVPLLEQAVSADPKFILAEVALSESYSTLAQRSLKPPAEVLPLAERTAQLAIEADPAIGEAHAALGFLRYCQWRWEEADQEFRLATQLAPNSATAWREWAYVDFAFGRFAEAEETLRRAGTLEPGSLKMAEVLAQIYYYWRRYDVAIAFSRQMLQLNQGQLANEDFIPHMIIADSLVQTKRPQEALSEWRRMLETHPGKEVDNRLTVYQAANGDTLPLRRLIEESQKSGAYVSPWTISWYYAHLGDVPSALKFLERAVDERDSDVISVRWDPVFDNVRRDDAYRQVLKKIGF